MNKSYISTFTKSSIIKGTIILTFAGFITRIIGFLFRIFLTGKIGAEGLGIYQLIFPIQIVCFSFCTMGFEMAISKLVAANKKSSDNAGLYYLISGILMSVIISVVITIIVFTNSDYIARRLLLEPRCSELVMYMSLSIPLASIHSCICGYYLGIKNSRIPALTQVIEQLIRVISIYLIIMLFEKYNYRVTPVVAVMGSVIGELSSTIYCILSINKNLRKNFKYSVFYQKIKYVSKEIFMLSFPLTLNKLMLSILQSIQSVLIPSMLITYGLSSKDALSIYGIILGLVLPLIMFPSAIVNSMALLLLPAISEADSNNNTDKIQIATQKATFFSIVFGILCLGIFARYGNEISLLLFRNNSGKYISSLGLICPFIFVTATMASTINGLGHTEITFIHNIVSTLIQILSIIFLIPRYGINGYITGLIISTVISAISHYISMYHLIKFKLNIMNTFIYPFIVIFLLIKICDFVFLNIITLSTIYAFICSGVVICILYSLIYINIFKHLN